MEPLEGASPSDSASAASVSKRTADLKVPRRPESALGANTGANTGADAKPADPLDEARVDAAPSLLTRAAATLAADGTGAFTLDDLVRRSAFEHYREALRQYLAIRFASIARADTALAELRRQFASCDGVALGSPPGIRARLYAMARELLRPEESSPGRTQREALPWRPSPGDLQPAELATLRQVLNDREAELVELRHARELSPEEIAFVVVRPLEDVLTDLEEATAKLQKRLARMRVDRTLSLRQVMLRAFALQPTESASEESQETAPPLPIGTILSGRYELRKRVGRGSFGDVYRARDTQVPGHDVALKILHNPAFSEESRRVSLRELRLIASVFHPSIVQFKDHGWHEGRLWFVMPWYEGETLQARIRRAPLRRDEALSIFQTLARALAAMHASGVRHQDVKPDNIFLARLRGFGDAEVLPVLLDLGVAAKDAERVVAGTPTYFAPEVAAQFSADPQHRPRITPKADVFSLALALRNSLEPSTQPDVPAGAVEAFIEKRAITRPADPLEPELAFLAPQWARWMSVDADERPTAEEFAEELRVLIAPEERRRRRRAALRRGLPWVATLLLVFGAFSVALHLRAEEQRLAAERAKLAGEKLRVDLQDSHRRQESLAQSAKAIGESYAETRRAADLLAARLSGREREVRRLQTAEERIQADRTRLELSLEEARRALGERESSLKVATETISTLRENVQNAENDARGERTKRADALAQLTGLRAELGEAERRAKQAERDVQGLRVSKNLLETRLSAEAAKSERLERRLSEAFAAKAELEASLAAARRAKERARSSEEPRTNANPGENEARGEERSTQGADTETSLPTAEGPGRP